MSTQAPVTVQIDSDPQKLCIVRAAVETALGVLGMETPIADRVVIAVDEAVTNVIRHAYQGQPEQPIWVTIEPARYHDQPAARIIVEDQAKDVDLSRITTRSLDIVKPGGLGVCIIRDVMDSVEYIHRPGGIGVRLTMIKRLEPPESPESPPPETPEAMQPPQSSNSSAKQAK
jgi:anti-sigma regulatory factor (Ser/Thr protein kinase)